MPPLKVGTHPAPQGPGRLRFCGGLDGVTWVEPIGGGLLNRSQTNKPSVEPGVGKLVLFGIVVKAQVLFTRRPDGLFGRQVPAGSVLGTCCRQFAESSGSLPLTSKKGAGGGAPSLIAAEVGRDRSQPPFSASGADGRGHRQKKKKKKPAGSLPGHLPGSGPVAAAQRGGYRFGCIPTP